jgi:HlyD family secretion protein
MRSVAMLWQALRSRARALPLAARARVQAALRAVQPCLRRDYWTIENLRVTWLAVRRRPRRTVMVLASACGLGASVFFIAWSRLPPEGVALAEVRQGPFEVAVVEAGTLQALRSVTYASTIQSNQAKIVALTPEGKLVQKGELLILFDSAPFEEEIRKNQALLAQAQADLENARQDLKLQAIENAEALALARQKLEQAQLELRDVREGKGRVKEDEAAAALANAERELKKAQGAADDLRPLLAEGFITKQELERAEQAVQKAAEDLALAKRRRDALQSFGRPIEVAQASAAATMTKESVRQIENAASFRLEQRRTAITAAESRIQEASARLALARQQLARTEVRADVPGIVVYRPVYFGSEQRKPQVGDQVWANQPLLILPDISKMVVESRVRETDIHKVERNQRVSVRVDAYPALKLTGRVTLIGTLAQEERERRGAKFFGITIEVNESDPRLRPGMSTRVEIAVERRATAIFVPLEAVFEKNGGSVCYVVQGRHIGARPVALGPSNEDFVVVESGLRPGERVCLRRPDAPASEFDTTAGP